MLCSDTGSHEAVRFEHLDKPSIEQINQFIGMFKQFCRGRGRLTLHVEGGTIADFETTTKTPNQRRKKAV